MSSGYKKIDTLMLIFQIIDFFSLFGFSEIFVLLKEFMDLLKKSGNFNRLFS